MEFRIADTFTDSLARLAAEDQKAAKMAAFDLQLNPAHPSLQFHKLDKAKDPNFWSIRVSRDLRIIVHRTGTSLLLCYVSHHNRCLHAGDSGERPGDGQFNSPGVESEGRLFSSHWKEVFAKTPNAESGAAERRSRCG